MKAINTAILSYGMSGSVFHAPLLHVHQGFNITKVWERNSNRADKRYPYITVVRTLDEILSDNSIELVIVNTPDHTHVDFCTKCLNAGKHIVVEKPFVLNSADGQKLIDLANSKKLVLSVFQNRRWDGDFLTTQKMVNSDALGRIVEFESHYDRFRNFIQNSWKESADSGTGTLYNLGSHMIDQALVLFGTPNEITADIRSNRDNAKVDDYFDLRLDYGKFKAILKGSYLVKEAGPRYAVHGTKGSFVKFGIDPQEEALKLGGYPDAHNWGNENECDWGILNSEIEGQNYRGKVETIPGNYMAYYNNIFDSIRKNAPLAVPANEALNVIKIIELAKESNKLRKSLKVSL